MKGRYLEVTFRKGKLVAAYLYLPRAQGAKSARTAAIAPGLLADYAGDGTLIGLELSAPHQVSLDEINRVLREAGTAPASADELAPLRAA